MALKDEKCVPCRGTVEPLSRPEAESLAVGVPEWTLEDDATKVARRFRFGDFASAMQFVQRVGAIAEAEGHHPDIAFGWGYCTVTFQTHKIRGLHRNDFVMAARVDEVAGLDSPAPDRPGG